MASAAPWDGDGSTRRWYRWWTIALGVAFCSYYGLLVWSDLTRPAPLGVVTAIGDTGLMVRHVEAGSPSDRAGLLPGDRVVGGDGRPIGHRLDWTAVAMNLRIGHPLVLEVVRDGVTQPFILTPTRAPLSYWTTAGGTTLLGARFVQCVALVLALVVAWRRPDVWPARLGAWALASMAIYSIDWPYQMAAHWRALPAPLGAILWLPFASSLVVPAVLVTFFAAFPRPVLPVRWLAAAWIPIVILAAIQIAVVARVVYAPAVAAPPFDWTVWRSALGGAYGIGAVVLLVTGYRRLGDVTERRRVRTLMAGSLVGLVSLLPVAGLYWSRPDGLGDSIFASPWIAGATLLGLVMPMSFAYAILRHRLFSVGFLVRAGLQYALARRVVLWIAPAAVVLFLADSRIHRDAPFGDVLQTRGWGYLLLATGAIVARMRRDAWLDVLDRRFFRERYHAEQVLRTVAEDVRRAPAREQAVSSAVARLEAALHPRLAAALVRRAGDTAYRVAAAAPASAGVEALSADSRLVGLLQWMDAPLRVADADRARVLRQLPRDDRAWLARVQADLLVPVRGRHTSIDGLLALGPKRSQEPYSAADEDLLMAIAHSLADLPASAPEASPPAVLRECPECGACHDATVLRCPADGSHLMPQPVTRVLAGRYRLDRRIGRGGMGTVYEASDIALERRVAVKVVRDDVADALGGSLDRFTREARIAAALVHPNVVTIHDVGTSDGRAFLVMERLEGWTLREDLCRAGPLPPGRALPLLAGICAAVDAAHRQQIVHRDLKPENVLVCRGDAGEIVKVLDFGLAKSLDVSSSSTALTRAGVVGGTPGYMSPEHRRGDDPSPDWDLWALAVIAHEMLTGVRPPPDGSTPDVADALPAPLAACFRRALSPVAFERPESGRELLEALAAAVQACDELSP